VRKGVRLLVSPQVNAHVCSLFRGGPVYPREPGAKARLPVRHELYCEALDGVADPETTWSDEIAASTQEGG
jgi:hypothetical protein